MATRSPNEDCYSMSADPQGYCIIINNVHFDTDDLPEGSTDRIGSDIDTDNLEDLFGTFLNFKVIRKNDVNLRELRDLLTQYKCKNHWQYDALVVIILSHGDSGDVIFTTDGQTVKINEIAKCFNTKNCPSLSNKPKVFIIQACRGPLPNELRAIPINYSLNTNCHQDTHSITSIAHDGKGDPPQVFTAPEESDTLYAYATIEGHTALRDCENGSWFIQELVSVIRERAHDTHLLDMLTIVNDRVSNKYQLNNEVQVTQMKSSLRKQLFLKCPPQADRFTSSPLSYHPHLPSNSSRSLSSIPSHYNSHHLPYSFSHGTITESHDQQYTIQHSRPHSPSLPVSYGQLFNFSPSPQNKPTISRQVTDPVFNTTIPPIQNITPSMSLPVLTKQRVVTPSAIRRYQNTSNNSLLLIPPSSKIPPCCTFSKSSLVSSEGSILFKSSTPPPHELLQNRGLLLPPEHEDKGSTHSSAGSHTSVLDTQKNKDVSSSQGYNCTIINNNGSLYGEEMCVSHSSIHLTNPSQRAIATPPPNITKHLSLLETGLPHSNPQKRQHTIATQPTEDITFPYLHPTIPASTQQSETSLFSQTSINEETHPSLINTKYLLPPEDQPQLSNSSNKSIPDTQKLYKMNEDVSNPQGYCIIINNNGILYEKEQLEEIKDVFRHQLGFHVQVYSDLTRKAIHQLLTGVASTDHTDLHCLIIIIMSKGGKEKVIYGSDGKKCHLKDIMMLFSPYNCPSLINKPKLFFIDTQLDEQRGGVRTGTEEVWEIPDTYVVSHFGRGRQQRDAKRRFLMKLSTVLCEGFLFKEEMTKFTNSIDYDEVVLADNLTKPLQFTIRIRSAERDVSNEGQYVVKEIKLTLEVLSKLRDASINELKRKRDDIFRVCQNARRTRVAGAATSLVGGGLTIIGFGLIPVTLGASLAISAVGAGVGVTGGAVSIASIATNKFVSKTKLKKAQAILEIDRQLTKQVNDLFERLDKIIDNVQRNEHTSREGAISIILSGGRQLARVGAVATKTGIGAAQMGRAAAQGSVFALRVAGPAARSFAVVGGVITALTIPLDIFEIVYNSVQLYKKSETDAIKWFNEQLDTLRKEKKEIEQMLHELTNVQLSLLSTDPPPHSSLEPPPDY